MHSSQRSRKFKLATRVRQARARAQWHRAVWAARMAVFWVSVLVLGKGDGIADTDLPAAV